jgi:phage terminase large subunit
VGSARHYDWDTYHFFPDVHDDDLLNWRERVGDDRPGGYKTGQYAQDQWLKQMEDYMKQVSAKQAQNFHNCRIVLPIEMVVSDNRATSNIHPFKPMALDLISNFIMVL